MPSGSLHAAFLWGAFWTAVFAYHWSEAAGGATLRFVLGLVLGAGLAHLGWVLLHLPRLSPHPSTVFDVSRGFTVLAVPIGVLLMTPWRGPRGARAVFLASALRSLPLAFAVAKLGCLAAGCCRGVPVGAIARVLLPLGPTHPTALYEVAGFVALHHAVQRASQWRAPGIFALGFGATRLAVEPFRAVPELGEPVVPAMLLAAAWIVGSFLLVRLPQSSPREAAGLVDPPNAVDASRT